MKFGRVVRDPQDLGKDATWIKLMVGDNHRLDEVLASYFAPDSRRRDAVRAHLATGKSVAAVFALDNDGDPQLRTVVEIDCPGARW